MATEPQDLPAGRIDLHSHLLPGLDDGCQSLSESIACVRRLRECGFVGSVCTPHLWPHTFPDNTPSNIARAVSILQDQLREAGLDYRLWPGGELRLALDSIGWIEEVGVPTLGSSRCTLVDYWGTTWPPFAEEVCLYLVERGYRPILAHPERLEFEDEHLDDVLRSVEQMGVWLQGNFNSMTGGEGLAASQRVRWLLREGRYQVMAMDMHGPDSLAGRLEGMAMVEAEAGSEALATLIEARPWRILSGVCDI